MVGGTIHGPYLPTFSFTYYRKEFLDYQTTLTHPLCIYFTVELMSLPRKGLYVYPTVSLIL